MGSSSRPRGKRDLSTKPTKERFPPHPAIPFPPKMLPLSIFSYQIITRRFEDETLRILESLLASKDVKSLIEARSKLKHFLRSESSTIINEISEKTVDQKLLVLECLVHAFALIGDIESCLAFKYEGLLLRELKSTSHQWLRVSYMEWLNFAEHSLDNGFYSIARLASEKALLCLQITETSDNEFVENAQVIEKIKRVKDLAARLGASGSVQAQAAEYLKKKTVEKSKTHPSFCKGTNYVASSLFRKGIKKRHARKFLEHQRIQKKNEF